MLFRSLLKTLKDKDLSRKGNISRLIGAANVWYWGIDVGDLADDMVKSGIKKVLMSSTDKWNVKRINKLVYSFENILDTVLFNGLRILIGLPFIIVTIWIQHAILGIIFAVFIVLFVLLQFWFFKIQIPYENRSNIRDSKAS